MLTPKEVLDQAFLDVRSMLLEIAATLDRYDDAVSRLEVTAGDQAKGTDARLAKIYEAIGILAERSSNRYRTERLLELFSV